VDYRNAVGVAAPTAVPSSFRYVANGTDRTDPVSAVQRSLIQGVSFQINAPVALNAGQTLADLLSIIRESPAETPGYATRTLPADNTVLNAGALDLTNSTIVVDGASGLTTVTVRFRNLGAYADSGSTVMTEFGSLIDGVYRANLNGTAALL